MTGRQVAEDEDEHDMKRALLALADGRIVDPPHPTLSPEGEAETSTL
ncbi:MAG TPA: hypothetical protein VLY45_00355 [Nitrospiria bacterium]|nr:hypothetical protein [Nitrospiria bacterium]